MFGVKYLSKDRAEPQLLVANRRQEHRSEEIITLKNELKLVHCPTTELIKAKYSDEKT